MKAVLVFLVIVFCFVGLAACALAYYRYKNLNWYAPYKRALRRVGAVEKQAVLPDGSVINYGEVLNEKPALLLIHGQMGMWEDYALVMEELSKKWHIYAVDVFGHGESSHEEGLYYLDTNADALIWFINHVIKEKTVVSGHSNGAITAAYIGAYGGENVAGLVLEDPPVFSTAGEGWEESFAYLDTYKPLHDYGLSDKSECFESYYLRHCLWGQLFMKKAMPKIADYAERYHRHHPDQAVKIGFLPSDMWYIFDFARFYDHAYGERFYDLTWNHGLTHEGILNDIKVPCVYLHAKEMKSEEGIYLCAASREQAMRAVSLIGESCRLVETPDSNHVIHTHHREIYLSCVNGMLQ